MKKTLIALTLAALPVASMAEVTLFGTIKGGLEVTKVKGVKNTVTNLNDWDSSIGFKGEEDLGNGLKAIWQLQSKAGINAANARNDRRNDLTSFIGLDAGTFGKIRAGNLPDAIKDMGDLNLDDSGHGVRDLGNWEDTGARYTAARYDSANFGGFSFNVLYSPEDNQRYEKLGSPSVHGFEQAYGGGENIPAVLNGATHNGNRWVASLGLNYEIAGFFVKYGYTHQNDRHDFYNSNVHRLMGGYDANNIFVGMGYQYTKGFFGPKMATSEIALSAAYRIGNVVPRLSYVHGFKQKSFGEKVPHSKYDQVVLGADYHLSKRTTVIASLGWAKEGALAYAGWDAAGNPTSGGLVGFVKDKETGDWKTKEQAYSFGLGLRHKF